VWLHHAEGLLDPQVERTSHMPGDMTAQGTETARHGALGLHTTLLHAPTRLEGSISQVFQLLMRGVVGCLDRLGLGHRRPKSRP
jgi:hypothetical protein